MATDSGRPGVASNRNLFSIIDYLSAEGEAGVTELADAVGLTKGGVHKHLVTLEQNEYVINRNGKYRLSLRFLTIGAEVRSQYDLCNEARAGIRELADKTGEIITMGLLEHWKVVLAFVRNEQYGVIRASPTGDRLLPHQCAEGKAILAELSDSDTEKFLRNYELEKLTLETISEEEDLRQEIEQIRRRGYSISSEEQLEGVNAIAAAVSDPRTDILGAVGIAGPSRRLSKAQLQDAYADKLLKMVDDLKLKLRYLD